MHLVYPIFDVLCLSSIVEGFPNVIGEAMACQVPCISTDVGDAKQIIGVTGLVVDVQSPVAFATAMKHLFSLSPSERYSMGIAARNRVKTYFSLETSMQSYSRIYS